MDTSNEKAHAESKLKKIPGGIPFILSICCIERYVAGSIVAILALYLNRKLHFDQSTSTAILHLNDFLVYFFTIIGAVVGDCWWGSYKTIAWMMIVFLCGTVIVSVGAIESLHLPMIALTFIGLLIINIGSGGVRPNLNALGGIQYRLPEQTNELKFFFAIQFVALKSGSLIAFFVAPTLRGDVTCFGMDDCYPLAFGVPAMATLLSFVIFTALKQKFSWKKDNVLHWLDYGENKHGLKLVENTKSVLSVLVMFAPLPVFWSGYLLQNSRWVFQAAKMNGDIGWYIVKPDQMIVFNPIIAIISLPICEYIFYPLVAKVGIRTSLQRMTFGGILGAISVGLSTIIEIKIESDYLSMMWLIPQYLFMALAENFVYVANMNFAYNEAPPEMKSVITSFVFVTIAGGNLIIVFITGLKLFGSQVYEFLFFTIFIFLDMIFFGFLATRYKYVQNDGNITEK